jgi:hypothetical protein
MYVPVSLSKGRVAWRRCPTATVDVPVGRSARSGVQRPQVRSVGMDAPPLHPDLAHLAFLLGTWTGGGDGSYPTIEPFGWVDSTRFWHVGKPGMLYEQRTKDRGTGEPKHAESGFLRLGEAPGSIELVVAHNTGHVELAVGTVTGTRIELASTLVEGTPTAKSVSELHRAFEVDGDQLTVSMAMAAVDLPLTHHLGSTLTRQS